jgi:hypothetical protein
VVDVWNRRATAVIRSLQIEKSFTFIAFDKTIAERALAFELPVEGAA